MNIEYENPSYLDFCSPYYPEPSQTSFLVQSVHYLEESTELSSPSPHFFLDDSADRKPC